MKRGVVMEKTINVEVENGQTLRITGIEYKIRRAKKSDYRPDACIKITGGKGTIEVCESKKIVLKKFKTKDIKSKDKKSTASISIWK